MRRWLAGSAACGVAVMTARRCRSILAAAPGTRPWNAFVPFTIGSARELALLRRLYPDTGEPAPGVDVEAHHPDGVPVFVHRPSGPAAGPRAALLWLHGGGLVAGTAIADHALCGRLAVELDIVVVSVDYRLAPEHPFPAALDDCAAALAFLRDAADELGVDPARIAVGGASAGGGLAATLAQRDLDLDRGAAPLAFQLLIYPMLDDRTTLRRPAAGVGRLGWTPRSNGFAWRAYLGSRPRPGVAPPYAAAARRDDLAALPPAWLGVGALDLFHDEVVAYGRRLAEAGVPVEVHVEPRMFHGADLAFPDQPGMRRFRERLVAALAEALAAGPVAPEL
ncbi:alpha/beta hydrolase fold domain-containing protein [Nocardioides sp. LHD-245]|uniref:alpha/beta hydrolase fold domain-containing protein n=1 Tax=Nocardioides sp. LHD-245 TaxID=3051387 RepID=UPI0027E0E5E5|nr:alpha/beta hydrolase fold domain-containing protein [Nocardioides sp. LHD-245]